jgi:hypothetical protein
LKKTKIFCILTQTELIEESWLSISSVSAETTTKVTSISICVGCCAGVDPWGTRTRRKKNSLLSKQQLLSCRCTISTIRLHYRRSLRWWWTVLTVMATNKWWEPYLSSTVSSLTWSILPECSTWCWTLRKTSRKRTCWPVREKEIGKLSKINVKIKLKSPNRVMLDLLKCTSL